MKGDKWAKAGEAAEVVIIEMGTSDSRNLSPTEAARWMRVMPWYNVLAASTSQVKFVVFVNQPTYKQVCPPKRTKNSRRSKKYQNWKFGEVVDGSKWSGVGVQVVQELGIQALSLQASVAELYGGMFTTDAYGAIWQAAAKCRSYTQNDIDYSENGQLALWADSENPTALGAETHFQCLVDTFRIRFGSSPPPTIQSGNLSMLKQIQSASSVAGAFHQFHKFDESRSFARSRSRERQGAARKSAIK